VNEKTITLRNDRAKQILEKAAKDLILTDMVVRNPLKDDGSTIEMGKLLDKLNVVIRKNALLYDPYTAILHGLISYLIERVETITIPKIEAAESLYLLTIEELGTEVESMKDDSDRALQAEQSARLYERKMNDVFAEFAKVKRVIDESYTRCRDLVVPDVEKK